MLLRTSWATYLQGQDVDLTEVCFFLEWTFYQGRGQVRLTRVKLPLRRWLELEDKIKMGKGQLFK